MNTRETSDHERIATRETNDCERVNTRETSVASLSKQEKKFLILYEKHRAELGGGLLDHEGKAGEGQRQEPG